MESKDVLEKLIHNVEKVLVGKREVIEDTIITLIAGGHLLLEDRPGVGKTTLAKAIAASVDCDFKRIQFTPDTLPSDITGVSVYNVKSGLFEYQKGSVMSQIILADEINRTSPKTQASLLEAMEEGQVTVDGNTYPLPKPFMVIATQNPIDYLGTYHLPEAQLDRFFMKLSIGYPSEEDEIKMVDIYLKQEKAITLSPVTDVATILELQKEVLEVTISEKLVEYVIQLIRETRISKYLSLGASPRATLMLLRAAQAKALMSGRNYCIPDDIISMIPKVLAHRLQLSPDALVAEQTPEKVLKAIVARLIIPVSRK